MKIIKNILKLIPFLIITLINIGILMDDIRILFFCILLWWIVIIPVVLSMVFFIGSIHCSNAWERTIVIWSTLNTMLFALCLFADNTDKNCTPDTMAEHYDAHSNDMEKLHNYVKTAIDDSCSIDLEFDGRRADRFHVKNITTKISQKHWDEEAELLKDSLMTIVGLTEEEYKNIRKQLKDMDCLGIKFSQLSSDRMTIYFCREGMGLYSYNIYSRPLTEKEECNAIEDLALIPYNEHCIFEYGGGAIGPQTFTTEEKEEFIKRNNNM